MFIGFATTDWFRLWMKILFLVTIKNTIQFTKLPMFVALSLLTFFLWTICFSLSKIALQYSSPIFLTAFRMGLAGCILVIYLHFFKNLQRKILKSDYLPLAAFALFSMYFTNIFEFWGLKHVSAAKTCFLYSLTPFFTIALSYVHFGEKISWLKSFGIVLAFLALIPVLLTKSGSEDLFRLSSFLSLPELSVIAAAFFSTYGWIILRMLMKNNALSPLVVNGYGMALGSIFAFTHSGFVENWSIPSYTLAKSFLLPVLLITLISNLICYNLYSYLLKHLTATFLSFVGLLSPIFTSISSFILLGEPISLEIIFSSALMLVALFFVYYAEIQQGYIQRRAPLPSESSSVE